jgi:hypothetical protein
VTSLRLAAALSLALVCHAAPASAQPAPKGYVSLFGDFFPNREDTTELRARIFAEEKIEPSPAIRLTVSGFAEGLVARRPDRDRSFTETDGILKVHDANVELLGARADVLAGYARVTWGKLDEIQPTDVVNPLDVSRFFFEGRSEARLPVLLVRGRIHPSERLSIEGLYVPDFRRGRFDQLAEPTSPFNLAAGVADDPAVCLAIGCPSLPLTIDDRQPALTWRNAQGGARLSATTGRVDWSVSAYRGFEPFGLYRLDGGPAVPGSPVQPPAIIQEYPRFTMIGGDFEAVRGQWGIRGEMAAFPDDNFQSAELRIVPGDSFDAGVGVDRKAGDYTISGTVLVHTESYDAPLTSRDSSTSRTDVSFIASTDRTFARERYRLRGFGVYNPSESSAFLRAIFMANLRDNLGLEGSVGWFAGDGRDLVGRFGDSDFVYARLKYYF